MVASGSDTEEAQVTPGEMGAHTDAGCPKRQLADAIRHVRRWSLGQVFHRLLTEVGP